jgi:hypothetical protein
LGGLRLRAGLGVRRGLVEVPILRVIGLPSAVARINRSYPAPPRVGGRIDAACRYPTMPRAVTCLRTAFQRRLAASLASAALIRRRRLGIVLSVRRVCRL